MLAAAFLRIRELSFPYWLRQRNEREEELLLLIRRGQAVEALEQVRVTRPDLLTPGSTVYLSLYVQVFIEFLREGKTWLALQTARQTLGAYKEARVPTGSGSVSIRHVMGLLCTERPEDSAASDLLSSAQREVVCAVLRLGLSNGN